MHAPAHRAFPALGPRVRRAVVRAACLTAGLGVVVVGGSGMAMQDQPTRHEFEVEAAPSSAVGRLIERYDCSTLGFDDGSTPQGAVVRRADGRLAVVTFDEGWRVHVADGAARLIAVCLRPPR